MAMSSTTTDVVADAVAGATKSSSVLVVIVNYRTPDLTLACLRSLAQEVPSLPDGQVVVVDNASGDGSVEAIGGAIAQEGWSAWATVLPSTYNGGYAYGNNFAIRPALQQPNPPDYVLLLNSDAQVFPGALRSLTDFLDAHPQVGIAGSAMINPDGSEWSTAFRFPSFFSEVEQGFRLGVVSKLLSKWVVAQQMGQEPQPIDWLPGASMMIRRQVFESIGLMDEGYFLYYEETDFCLQAKRAGWPCWYVPDSKVMHIAGQSTGINDRTRAPKRLPQYMFDSRRRYFLKNHGLLYTLLTDLAWVVAFSTWRLRRILQRKPDLDPPYLLWDQVQNSALFNLGTGMPDASIRKPPKVLDTPSTPSQEQPI